jgi:hypothetical protein
LANSGEDPSGIFPNSDSAIIGTCSVSNNSKGWQNKVFFCGS